MENRPDSDSLTRVGRRQFLATSTAAIAGIASARVTLGREANKNSRLRVLQIGAGGIGQLDRGNIRKHPQVEFVGFCDVDEQALEKMRVEFPKAFRLHDYREAFDKRADQFDAVIVDTPDFHHAAMMITALEHRKHVYGQKPLVQQLDEMRLLREAIAKRPECVTQMGNQRASNKGRMQAVEMLRRNQLGKPIEAHVWTGKVERSSHFAAPWSDPPEAQPIPKNLHWDLWNGLLTEPMPYSEEVAPKRWRAYWNTGSGQLGDWGCHLIDVLYFAYDLPSPEAVQTNTIRPAGYGHSAYNQSVITYPGGGERFAREKFVLHYNDSDLRPSFRSLGLPAFRAYVNETLVVCEDGAMLLGDLGRIDIFRKGHHIKNEPIPELEERDHWQDWPSRCLDPRRSVQSSFEMGLRVTEPTLLSVKATRFPGQELHWDGKSYRFTNHDGANRELLRRDYREGFAPPKITS